MHLDKIEEDPGHVEYQGDKELPTLLGTKLTTSVITVKDCLLYTSISPIVIKLLNIMMATFMFISY